MDHAARCAFIYAQVACAMAETAAMQASNQIAAQRDLPVQWNYSDFMAVQDKYCIGHNAVIEYLRDG